MDIVLEDLIIDRNEPEEEPEHGTSCTGEIFVAVDRHSRIYFIEFGECSDAYSEWQQDIDTFFDVEELEAGPGEEAGLYKTNATVSHYTIETSCGTDYDYEVELSDLKLIVEAVVL